MTSNDLARAMAEGWRNPDDLPMALFAVLQAESAPKVGAAPHSAPESAPKVPKNSSFAPPENC